MNAGQLGNGLTLHRVSQESVYRDYTEVPGPDSSVGIATRYGPDGSGIESRWGRDFPHLSRPALEPTQPPIQ
jgi:hypothetical protein